MSVTVKTFAHLREQLGVAETVVSADSVATVADVWQALSGHSEIPDHILAAVNLDYARADSPVRDGDEVAFFPPVTGG
jgi:molybdopterin synthase sulfur carrier subunit